MPVYEFLGFLFMFELEQHSVPGRRLYRIKVIFCRDITVLNFSSSGFYIVALEEFDTLGIFLAKYLGFAAFDEYIESFAEDFCVNTVQF